MDETIIFIVIGLCALLAPTLMRLPFVRKRFRNMDYQKLVLSHVNARILLKLVIAAAIGILIMFALTMLPTIKDIAVRIHAINFLILMIMSAVGAIWGYWELVRITKSEMEYRVEKEMEDKPANNRINADQ